jgi:hypothetical protein
LRRGDADLLADDRAQQGLVTAIAQARRGIARTLQRRGESGLDALAARRSSF